jgi:hypothetical protein
LCQTILGLAQNTIAKIANIQTIDLVR